ncbi:YceI family protein [Celeribacter ethanolicus]|jgi:polyisoprenoid-binding protein YceI|uniref:Polyisoprenoid-binding protein n=1 Tax=Celeribacter ethanolicus TaxID=1758178 RepID=A0A291GGY4_9RHOB|nr:YceI family protein [Celeribacter ethanolicus]ATG49350.1 polyisoprenoid-binding protein [Celeribacter ethanolicus]TNE67380.1 MAG: polyisoprenoid-binding protein [Paracoccaceae bacterium]
MKHLLLTSALVLGATAASAEPVKYALDASHSQIVFTYEHLGFSTTTGMFSGFDGTIMFDEADPANSSVEVSFPTDSLYTGWAERTAHFLTGDFFGAEENPTISFKSTSITVEDEDEGLITGDLTINGITKSVTIEAELTQKGEHPMMNKPWLGFDGELTVLRSDFDMGQYAPYISDEVEIEISIEAMLAE